MKKKIVILRGGPSSEYDVSMRSGRDVMDELVDLYNIIDIVVDKEANWFSKGIQATPLNVCATVDLVFNAMHGEYGEDGQVQKILEDLQIPFTGSTSIASALSMNKALSKDVYQKFGIKTPIYKVLTKPDTVEGIEFQAKLVFQSFPMPLIIKPVGLGSSIGVSIARDWASLLDTLTTLYMTYDKVLIEEYIEGREATVGIVDNFRDKKNYSLLPIEIKTPEKSDFFDYDAKYSGETEEISPGNFNNEETKLLQKLSIKAHQSLGLRHYSRSDFILHPNRGIYILETNSLPGLTKESLLPKSFEPIGSSYREFLEHTINEVLENRI